MRPSLVASCLTWHVGFSRANHFGAANRASDASAGTWAISSSWASEAVNAFFASLIVEPSATGARRS